MIRTANGAVVVDEHGHVGRLATTGGVDAADLVPHHRHDHVHHEHNASRVHGSSADSRSSPARRRFSVVTWNAPRASRSRSRTGQRRRVATRQLRQSLPLHGGTQNAARRPDDVDGAHGIDEEHGEVANTTAAARCSRRSGSTRSSARPASTPIADTVIIASEAPTSTDSGGRVVARLAVASWVRSPHSATNTMPNTVAAMRASRSCCPSRPDDESAGRRRSPRWGRWLRRLLRHSTTAPTANSPDDGELHRSLGEEAEQLRRRHGDDHLQRQRRRRSQPDGQRPVEAGRQHDRGDHRLVRELGEEHRGEGGDDRRHVHERAVNPCPGRATRPPAGDDVTGLR